MTKLGGDGGVEDDEGDGGGRGARRRGGGQAARARGGRGGGQAGRARGGGQEVEERGGRGDAQARRARGGGQEVEERGGRGGGQAGPSNTLIANQPATMINIRTLLQALQTADQTEAGDQHIVFQQYQANGQTFIAVPPNLASGQTFIVPAQGGPGLQAAQDLAGHAELEPREQRGRGRGRRQRSQFLRDTADEDRRRSAVTKRHYPTADQLFCLQG